VTDHHVGFLDKRQGSVEVYGWLRCEFCGSEVSAQWLWQSISSHQVMQDTQSISQ